MKRTVKLLPYVFLTVLLVAVALAAGLYPLFAGPPVSAKVSVPLNLPEQNALVRLLKAERFDDLEQIFGALQARYEKGSLGEKYVARAFAAFERADPEIAVPLKRWREAHAGSFAPHLAFGIYSLKLAWTNRGSAAGKFTNIEQHKAMVRFLGEARPALEEAIDRNPRLPMAWATLLSVSMATEPVDRRTAHYHRALVHVPDSSILHRRYHYAISPKWGGSPGAQVLLRMRLQLTYSDDPDFRWVHFYTARREIDAKFKHFDRNPWKSFFAKLQAELGIPPIVMERDQTPAEAKKSVEAQKKRYREALRLIDEMLVDGDSAWLRHKRGLALWGLENLDEALVEIERAVQRDPYSVRFREDLTRILGAHRRYRDAHDHWRHLVERDPYNPHLLVDYAVFLQGLGRNDKAGEQLRKALLFGSYDDRVHLEIGVFYWLEGRLEHAMEEMKQVVRLVPEFPGGWYYYGLALKRVGHCDAIGAYKEYLRLCRINGPCGEMYKSVARNEIQNIELGCD
ncbi:MAG: DUF4034 domain-containing protein [Alphaproteobacteria bacterium]|nr:DUF4034 domain-containing protein [Alphaproteobacteria bacterium]